MPDEGFYAIALDRDKQQVNAIASNVGHCLWTGIVDDSAARSVVERLLSPEFFTGFGIQTLATGNTRYNPVSCHNGSVWPHDTALIAAGIARDTPTRRRPRTPTRGQQTLTPTDRPGHAYS
ncbi:hypothetical protein RYJ27_01800 [Microbacterium limosum]|uniref:Mannosylglycerate hydrolase MGH1-like glycoside hydrolase domain-containing protein n=1 Tax=Microbacterium limosum TaxID=3079935 RepID=A0AAU0MJP9_9MICO|nr:hypothetical protein [Microbacterium sp. Y20]WOQ69992.1 hypothetical protein RYJ27_01800 [Microbacterium sp. Y20]